MDYHQNARLTIIVESGWVEPLWLSDARCKLPQAVSRSA